MNKNWKRILALVVVAIISVIALYGLIKAPSKASDHLADDLKKEFNENQKMIEEQKSAEDNQEKTQADEAKEKSITLIGDSVMLGAAPSLMEQIPGSVIDAKESRQARDAIDIIKGLEATDQVGDIVVIELGINSYFSPEKGQEIIDYLGKDKEIYWVTVYGKYLQDQERINEVIRGLAKDNDNVNVISWDEEAAKHGDWFYNDGIHLNGEGRTGFATVIREMLGLEAPEIPAENIEEATNEKE